MGVDAAQRVVVVHVDVQKILNYLLIVLAVCGGLAVGTSAARLIDLALVDEGMSLGAFPAGKAALRQLGESDFQVIVSRNLFDSTAVGKAAGQVDLSAGAIAATPREEPSTAVADLKLIGTVTAGAESLALIHNGKETGVFRLGEEPAPGATIEEIQRKMVVLSERGERRELLLQEPQQAQARLLTRQGGGDSSGIVPIDDRSWKIDRAVAANARGNLNSLLQSARMIPELKNGKTAGFKLVELQKGSLLEKIGLRTGDLIVEINQVALDSPEKALQIFQQLREANMISLGLIRNGQPENFEYRLE